jgi:sigma-B regulation protein RsbU (phosphoserine phosphatase)
MSRLLKVQTIYLAIAAIVAAVFWANGQQINPVTVILYSLLFGNSVSPVMAGISRFYKWRPFPYNWLLFWLLLLLVVCPVYVLSSVIVWWLTPPGSQTLYEWVSRGWKFPLLVIVVYGSIEYLYRSTREHLERRNRELQQTIELGSAQLEGQKRELQRAREIQESLLPRTIPQIPGFELAAAWRPAREVSGDYFDVFQLGENRIAFCIADVVGKGVSAALLMANVQAAVRAFAPDAESPATLCTKVNRLLCENIATGKFVTFVFGILDASAHTLAWCNAGNPEPIFVSERGMQVLDHSGAVLGVFPEWKYTDNRIEMRAGDHLLLFTDGITEAAANDQAEFGEERIAEVALAHRSESASELNRTVLSEVNAFCGSLFQDDATLLVIAAK